MGGPIVVAVVVSVAVVPHVVVVVPTSVFVAVIVTVGRPSLFFLFSNPS
jgi:hypothetical protein